MRPKPFNTKSRAKAPAEAVVKDIRRATRRHFSVEDNIRIVLDGLRGEDSIAEVVDIGQADAAAIAGDLRVLAE